MTKKEQIELGRRIYNARILLNISQIQASELLNCSQSFISKLENGEIEPKISFFLKLIKIYKQPIEYFIDLSK